MFNYSKDEIRKLSAKYGFRSETLEKALRLIDILKFVENNKTLNSNLALKGGTAINLTLFNLPRLSVDIDFDFSLNCSKEKMLAIRTDIKEILRSYMEREGYVLSSTTKTRHALDSFVFSYNNEFGNKDHLKIEINYMDRIHVFNTEKRASLIDFLPTFTINTLNKCELFGSKINALISRCTIRDIYDVYSLLRTNLLNQDEISCMKKCALFYLAISKSNTVCFNEVLNDFVNKIDQYRVNRVPQYLASTLKKSDQFSMIEMVDSVKTFILHLFALSEVENLFLNELGKCSYKPELLFDDDDIIERLKQHPMALLKLKHG